MNPWLHFPKPPKTQNIICLKMLHEIIQMSLITTYSIMYQKVLLYKGVTLYRIASKHGTTSDVVVTFQFFLMSVRRFSFRQSAEGTLSGGPNKSQTM